MIIIPYMLTFPGMFTPTGLLHANLQTAGWLWVCRHGGFPRELLSYALLDYRWGRVVLTEEMTRRLLWALLLLVPLVAGLLTAMTTVYARLLPVLILGVQYSALFTSTSPVGISLIGVSLANLLLSATKPRSPSRVDLWLTVVALAYFLDIAINLLTRNRYSIDWYESRLNTVVASLLALGVLLYEVSRVYAHLERSACRPSYSWISMVSRRSTIPTATALATCCCKWWLSG